MKPMARLLIPLVLLAVFIPARPDTYTNSYGYSFNNPVSASCNSMFWDSMNSRLIYRMMLKKHGYTNEQLGQMSTDQMLAALGGKDSAKAEVQKPIANPATRFVSTGNYLLLPALTQSLTKVPAEQKALLQVFDQGVQYYEKEAGPNGLGHDVAGAMVFLIAASYYVFNDGQDPNGDGTEILARAIQRNMDTPAFRQIADADKQKFYELMIGLGTYLGAAYQLAVNAKEVEQVKALKGVAADALKGFLKLDPKTVRITANGLEVSGGPR
jgi:hypothetical protein